MTKYTDFAEGLTPTGRVGAGAASKLLANADGRRSEIKFVVVDEEATVWFALGPTASLNEGLPVTSADGIQILRGYEGDLSMITSAEGANEVQVVTLSEAEGGTFILSFGGKTTEALGNEATKEEVAAALEALETIGAGNVEVTGEAGGPYTITFIEELKATDVEQLEADGSELEGESASVSVTTETPGGVSVAFVEW